MRVLLLSLFVLCASAGQTFAQVKMPPKAMVFYKDGSIFIGEIVRETSQEITLVISTLDTISINKNFIRRIRKTPQNIIVHNNSKFHYTKGFFAAIDVGFGLAENYTSQIDLTVGLRLNEKYSLGLGMGFHEYDSFLGNSWQSWIRNSFMPVYAYGRYYPWKKRWRPFADLKLGYGVPLQTWWGNENRKGGPLFQPGIGVHFSSRKNFRLKISLSQAIQRATGTSFGWDNFNNEVRYDYRLWYNRTMLKVGWEFR
ncbi:MAG: hypothetical protein AAF806_08335 [Bacteroidota bacterium]